MIEIKTEDHECDDKLTDAEIAMLVSGHSPLSVSLDRLVLYVPFVHDRDEDIERLRM